ncbi:MAG: hypothetical protein P9M11_01570 [Candidatus Tenebribacter burtonii]|jgi:hypothetical protein|nr:hypothetical protein [Candidatus Tenebribacter burtonii]
MKYEVCPICGSPAEQEREARSSTSYYNCLRCGEFVFPDITGIQLNDLSPIEIANISGWIRDNDNPKITTDIINNIQNQPSVPMLTKVDLLLKYLSVKFPIAGDPIDYNFNKVNELLNQIRNQTFPSVEDKHAFNVFENTAKKVLPLLSIGRILTRNEFNYILNNYLIQEKKYLSVNPLIITPKGWAHIETLKYTNPNSKKVFVAMWFEDGMKKICDDFIFPAIVKAGYEPIRIDNKEHNNDINDEIIAEIRSSRFVVADFTGNRGGVYYEAGFANGLNIPVIHMCKQDELQSVHFDVNHRNIIDWESEDDLYKRLLNRIKATII